MSDIPRRCRIDLFTPAEKAIRDAMLAVEAAGCDVRLTNAVVLLTDAQAWVADFVDGVDPSDHYPRPAQLAACPHGEPGCQCQAPMDPPPAAPETPATERDLGEVLGWQRRGEGLCTRGPSHDTRLCSCFDLGAPAPTTEDRHE